MTPAAEQPMALDDVKRQKLGVTPDKRQRLGVLNISKRLHGSLMRGPLKRQRILDDIAFLQAALVAWKDDGSLFSRAVKQVVQVAVAESLADGRLTPQEMNTIGGN